MAETSTGAEQAPTSVPVADDQAQAPETNGHGGDGHGHGSTAALTLGCVGVVYGDIGTSPLYALREALHHAAHDGVTRSEVIGIVSLLLWALILVVTIKYVIFLMRADNKGEGGTLSLMALAQRAYGSRAPWIFIIGVAGAALFYGDSMITPAISVLSSIEGMKLVTPLFEPYVLPITILILFGLFAVQSRGTQSVAAFFGPIMVLWFGTMAAMGIAHIGDDLGIFAAFNPYYAARFMVNHGWVGLAVLGSVFLAVTGGEALYADMGHFGKMPIRIAWMGLVFPSLALNYLGQGAMVLAKPGTVENPFFLMAPDFLLLPLVALSAVATIIASQAVITGAFSLTQQAVQLGLMPRIEIRHTSETLAGQIYIPRVNRLLLIGVMLLVFTFKTSSALATAYGIAVTGAMMVDTLLAFIVVWKAWGWRPWAAAAFVIPFLLIDLAFFGANLLKLFEGGWVPLTFGLLLGVVIWTWMRGTRILYQKAHKDSLPLADLARMLGKSQPHTVPGTAVFLTSDPDMAPTSLMHNLKHNRVLHQHNLILTIKTAEVPRVEQESRAIVTPHNDRFTGVQLTFGFMETPNVPLALAQLRKQGIKFDIMTTSFFLGRRLIKTNPKSEMPMWQEKLYISLAHDASNATDFYRIPPGRVVELGQQMTL